MAQALEDRELRHGEGRQAQKPGRGPIDWLGGWRTCLVGCSTFLLLALAIRIFQQYTAWTIGIDASTRDFGLYYRSLFIAEVVGVTTATLLWWGYLVRRGRKVVLKEANHPEEVRRIAVFWGLPWSFLLLIAASVTEMAQVAMNEWGHSLWITEEIFAVPFHWPFVFYGWLAAGIFALWAETLVRLLQIEGEIEAEAGQPAEEVA